MKNEQHQNSKPKAHIHIQTLGLVFMAVIISMISVVLYSGLRIYSDYKELITIEEKFTASINSSTELLRASDHLTDLMRLYVLHGGDEYLDNYLNESFVEKHREKAIETLQGLGNDESTEYLRKARDVSYDLMNEEYQAAVLIHYAEAPDTPLRTEIENWKNTNEDIVADDLLMSSEDMKEKAISLVVDENYQNKKEKIRNLVRDCEECINRDLNSKYEDFSVRLKNHLELQIIFIVSLLTVAVILCIVMQIMVLKPIKSFIRDLRNDKTIKAQCVAELVNFADVYNELYLQNQAYKDRLHFRAEHDALTGLLNRSAFDTVTHQLRNSGMSIALIMMDIDKFKDINDTYGHEVGDHALKKTADVLKSSFRGSDYVIRYGGDEFIVILTDITTAQMNVIDLKLGLIGQKLRTGDGRVSSITVSAGVAFGTDGFEEELLKTADEALYNTKNNGRNGYTICNENKMTFTSLKEGK